MKLPYRWLAIRKQLHETYNVSRLIIRPNSIGIRPLKLFLERFLDIQQI